MVMNQLKIGDEVQLVREENNKFDPYAVAIMFDGYKLGYIPRTNNEQFCAFMDQGSKEVFASSKPMTIIIPATASPDKYSYRA